MEGRPRLGGSFILDQDTAGFDWTPRMALFAAPNPPSPISEATRETHSFQAELKQLLDLVVHFRETQKSQGHCNKRPWDRLGVRKWSGQLPAAALTRRRRKRLPLVPFGTLAFTVSSASWVEVICWVTVSVLQLPASRVSLHSI